MKNVGNQSYILNRTIRRFALVALMVFTVGAQPETMSGKTALQFFADNDIRAGWNLGNTMDAMNNGYTLAVEGAWGTGKATQALFNGVKESGFDLVRIPATWIGHIGSAPEYKVSEERLARVDTIIGYAKTAGFKAMIINIHHDGNYTNPSLGTWGFVDMAKAVNDDAAKARIQDQLGKVWSQIADYFKDHGEYLIFETLNEVHSGHWGNGSADPAYVKEEEILFDWNQAALNAIRATGGNNATRFVAVPGLGSTEPHTVIAAHTRGNLLPNDGVNGTDKLIVSVHYYAPWRYTVAGVVATQGSELIHTWGTQTERTNLTNGIRSLKTNFIDKGIAVYIGEWGAPTNVRRTMSEEIRNTHIDYISSVVTAARINGIVPMYWDDGGNFRMLERSNGIPQAGLAADVLNAMMKAFGVDISSIAPQHRNTTLGRRAVSVFVRNNMLNVSSPDNAEMRIRVVNLSGKTIARFNAKGNASLSLRKIPVGVYIVEVNNKTGNAIAVRQKIAVRG